MLVCQEIIIKSETLQNEIREKFAGFVASVANRLTDKVSSIPLLFTQAYVLHLLEKQDKLKQSNEPQSVEQLPIANHFDAFLRCAVFEVHRRF